jgi:hypothetical protein
MPIFYLAVVAFGLLFYRAAHHEHLSPPLWVAASVSLSAGVTLLGHGVGAIAAAQAGLYVVMWWYNARRRGGRASSSNPRR